MGKERGLKAKEGSSLSVLGEKWFLEDWPKARQRVYEVMSNLGNSLQTAGWNKLRGAGEERVLAA